LIAQLSGKLIHKQPNTIIIDIGGVGYEVTIPLSTFYGLGEVGSEAALKIHTHVREDLIQLFGFLTTLEKELFLRLTRVSGIGPKLAIAMLSGLPAAELIPAIKNNDLGRLTAIPGVGRKTAERVVVELRDRIAALSLEEMASAATAQGAQAGADSMIRDDTVAALMQLGYQRAQAERAVDTALREEGDRTIQAVLKRSLKRLSR
jgi:Holliday junction DNA helicase RuvA